MKKIFLRAFTVFAVLILCTSGIASADVGYLGPAATYTEEAAILFFGEKETFVPVKTVQETLAGVKSGEFRYAVVPVENTVGGPVYNYLDAVIGDPAFAVSGEVNLPIRQTLMALPGTVLSDVKTILSHPQGIAQGKDWLKANLPDAKLVEVSSTAEGARKVATDGDKSVAAIASPQAAVTYKLDVLARQIEVTQTNVTRFWIVTLRPYQQLGPTRTALTVQGPATAFPPLLKDLERAGYKLVSLHDRPARTLLGEYVFVIELEGDGRRDALRETLAKYAGVFKANMLGSYEVK